MSTVKRQAPMALIDQLVLEQARKVSPHMRISDGWFRPIHIRLFFPDTPRELRKLDNRKVEYRLRKLHKLGYLDKSPGASDFRVSTGGLLEQSARRSRDAAGVASPDGLGEGNA